MGHRVLVVEDSGAIGRLIQLCLRERAIEVIVRNDGPSGLEAVTTEAPDLVILDIGLRGMDGWQVLEAIRSQEVTSHIPVLVMTGHTGEDIRIQAHSAGANGFLEKPFQPADLRETVFALLDRST